jgi:hypothetical protein
VKVTGRVLHNGEKMIVIIGENEMVGGAKCSPPDKFDRYTGLGIALLRLHKPTRREIGVANKIARDPSYKMQLFAVDLALLLNHIRTFGGMAMSYEIMKDTAPYIALARAVAPVLLPPLPIEPPSFSPGELVFCAGEDFGRELRRKHTGEWL